MKITNRSIPSKDVIIHHIIMYVSHKHAAKLYVKMLARYVVRKDLQMAVHNEQKY